MIYHVTTASEWNNAQSNGFYEVASLHSEGFIHMSKKEQVAGVLERYYKNVPELILLHVDETLIKAELKYERSPSLNEEFPHVYGPLNLDAVLNAEKII
ncbi:MAG: DUF952 domain-containing protein [Bacteroidota bacterium]